MNINEWLRLLASCVVLVSVVLAVSVSSYWLLLTAFIAVNLIQSSFTHWCPMMAVLRRFHVRES